MRAQTKCYNVAIKGKVQDVGYRKFIEGEANLLRLRGYVFNDIDGSVKVVCEGVEDSLNKFLAEIDLKDENMGVSVECIEKEEIMFPLHLPPKFAKLETDELADIGRKLDTGISELKGIRGDTSLLSKLEGYTSTLPSINEKIGTLDSINEKIGTLDSINEKIGTLDSINEKIGTLDSIDKKLDTLPERIAKALNK